MYQLHFRRFLHDQKDYVMLLGGQMFSTLEQARDARQVSGDLVVGAGTTEVVRSTRWMWDWEKADPISYAMRAASFCGKPAKKDF